MLYRDLLTLMFIYSVGNQPMRNVREEVPRIMFARESKNAQELLKAGVVACRDLGAYEGYTLGVRDSIEKGEINGPK